MRIGFFSGCLIDFVYPDIGQKIIDILTHFGCEVVIPPEQTCCGIPAMHEVALDNLAAFANKNIDAIITGCATCTSSLKRYAEILPDEGGEFASNVYGICDFLTDVLKISIDAKTDGELVTYHDSCHLKRRLNAQNQPRKLLEASGYTIHEMEDSDRCCGFAGAFAFDFPELSTRLGIRKMDNASETGTDIVAMDCPGCNLQR